MAFPVSHSSPPLSSSVRRLPAEIWLQIFRLATRIPGALTHSDYHAVAAFTRDPHGDSVHKHFRSAMEVKLAIASVCKDWNSLVSETLFSYLLIKTGEQARRTAVMLETQRLLCAQPRDPGWWVVRIELALDNIHAWTNSHTNALLHILHVSPNIAVFSTAFCTADPYSFYPSIVNAALAKFSSHSKLRRLELRGDLLSLNVTLSLVTAPLELLWILPVQRAYTTKAPVELDNLQRLKILVSAFNDTSGITCQWNLPVLRTFLTSDFSDLQFRIGTNGRQLLHLSLPNLFMLPKPSLSPNLQDLVIKFDHTTIMPYKELPAHPSVRCITVETPDLMCCCSWLDNEDRLPHRHHLRSSLLTLIPDNFPALECIQLLLPLPHSTDREVTMPLISSFWRAFFTLCLQRDIRVQFSRGADNWTADSWQPITLDLLEG